MKPRNDWFTCTYTARTQPLSSAARATGLCMSFKAICLVTRDQHGELLRIAQIARDTEIQQPGGGLDDLGCGQGHPDHDQSDRQQQQSQHELTAEQSPDCRTIQRSKIRKSRFSSIKGDPGTAHQPDADPEVDQSCGQKPGDAGKHIHQRGQNRRNDCEADEAPR